MFKIKLFSLAILIFTLSGCYGMREIDEAAYVLALGVDAGPGQNLIVSVAVHNPGRFTQGQTSTDKGSMSTSGVRLFTTQAPSIFSAFTIINSILERQIELGHTKLVVFGESLARQGIAGHMDTLVRWRKFRRTIYIGVAQGEAREVIQSIIPAAGENSADLLELTFIVQEFVGYTPRNQMLDFYNALKTKGEDPIAALIAPRITKYELKEEKAPITTGPGFEVDTGDPGRYSAGDAPVTGDAPLQLLGTAVFQEGKMVDKLTGNETIALSLLRGEFNRGFITLPDPGDSSKLMQLEISQLWRPRTRVTKKGDRLRTKVVLTLIVDKAGIESTRFKLSERRLNAIEGAVAEWVRTQCHGVFRKARGAGTDIFGFGNHARWLVSDWEAWRNWDYRSSFQGMELDLRENVHVDRTGLVIHKNALKEE